MTRGYRIALTGTGPAETRIDDLDLPLLLRHCDGRDRFDFLHITARTRRGDAVSVQWLPSSVPSAVPLQQRGTLLLGPAGDSKVELLVRAGEADDKADVVRIKESPDALEIAVDGQAFATYRYNTKDPELPRPYFHPLIGPTGQVITQLGEVPGKKEKHFHHTALWIAHQNFQPQGDAPLDNWQIGKKNSSRIEHVKFDAVAGGPLAGRFIERLHWLNGKGDRVLLAETRTVTVPKRPAERRVIDIDIALKAADAAVTLLKTPYHILAVRALDAMLPANGGAIVNSAGTKSPPDGAPADWIDISGKLAGTEQGVALFNHPSNFRHPTPCLQFAGQTIGLSPTHKEAHTIEPGKELRLRYRVLVHAGNVEAGKVAAEYAEYAKAGAVRVEGTERE